MNGLILWLAQGFYSGRARWTPGSFGSLVGIGWVLLLLMFGTTWAYVIGTLAGIGLSVWVCGRAEKILGQTDPGSVVFDEVVAMPSCFGAWLWLYTSRQGNWPAPDTLFSGNNGWWAAGIFVAFRFFDILKPWPVRQSQALPGGWGVTFDDQLAAAYVNVVVCAVWFILT